MAARPRGASRSVLTSTRPSRRKVRKPATPVATLSTVRRRAVVSDASGAVGVSTPTIRYFVSSTAGDAARVWIGTMTAPADRTLFIAAKKNMCGNLVSVGGLPSNLVFLSTPTAALVGIIITSYAGCGGGGGGNRFFGTVDMATSGGGGDMVKIRSMREGIAQIKQAIELAANKVKVDTFVVLTDSETWAGNIQPVQALAKYRQATGINAKLIVVGMTSTGFTIADPTDPGMLDVVGFDGATPALMAKFAKGLI